MDNVMNHKAMAETFSQSIKYTDNKSKLSQGNINVEYIIKEINTNDEDMINFLFTLGCYEGEPVTIISVLAENYIITVKDARYSIDMELAEVIMI